MGYLVWKYFLQPVFQFLPVLKTCHHLNLNISWVQCFICVKIANYFENLFNFLVSNLMIFFCKIWIFLATFELLWYMNLWFLELYHILCHILKLRSTLGKDYEIKSGVYWEQDWEHFAKHMGCKHMWGGNTGNICGVGTLGNTWPNTWERDTLEFLRTMETAFGKASSRINFQKTHREQIVSVIGNIMGEQKS